MTVPRTIVFDVNGTLTDQGSFAGRFEDVGAPGQLAQAWYAATLRDGFALTMAAAPAPYREVASAVLTGLLSGVETLSIDVDRAVEHVMAGFDSIAPHPDVVPGFRALAGSGHRLITLSNGAVAVAAGLMYLHGIADCATQTLSVDDAGAWKPHTRAYAYAAERAAVPAGELLMVAVHPWDIDGAARAGLQTAFLNRTGAPWPGVFRTPDLEVQSLPELDERLR